MNNDKTVGFLKWQRTEEADWLLENDPKAFLLLSLIARRARWSNRPCPEGLTYGQAFIGRGDSEKLKLTPAEYRGAVKRLERYGYARFKAVPKRGVRSEGTIATLTGSQIYSLRDERGDEEENKMTNGVAQKFSQPNSQPVSEVKLRKTANQAAHEQPINSHRIATNSEGQMEKNERIMEGESKALETTPPVSSSLVAGYANRTAANSNEEIRFPWDELNEIPEALWRAMRYEHGVTVEYLHRAFNAIRGRKLQFNDKRRAAEWPAVLIAEIQSYVDSRKTRPHESDRVWAGDWFGYGDYLGDVAWLRERGFNVKEHGERLMGPRQPIEAERQVLGYTEPKKQTLTEGPYAS